jgi:hypothetical protein
MTAPRTRGLDRAPPSAPIDHAVPLLKTALRRARAGDSPVASEIKKILSARDDVLDRYQEVFVPQSLGELTADEFRQFLQFKNNRHWMSLHRMGPAITKDMSRLHEALAILLDESRPVGDRLNELVPPKGPAFVPWLSKAVLTPILLIVHPDRYGVWNQVSEAGMRHLGVWPELDPALPFGDRYSLVNATLLELAQETGVDLWTLDALWWRISDLLDGGDNWEDDADEQRDADVAPKKLLPGAQFGLERHLHEFLRDNWDLTDLGKQWRIYEEDGDPEAGYEYQCDVGRMDLLAQHRTEHRWLVIELKRKQSSDQTVGQVLRYMGWVMEHLAKPADRVEGLIVAHESDVSVSYALKVVPSVALNLYEVEFRLRAVSTSLGGLHANPKLA